MRKCTQQMTAIAKLAALILLTGTAYAPESGAGQNESATSKSPQRRFCVPDPQLRAYLGKLKTEPGEGFYHDQALRLLTNAIRLVGLSGDKSQLERVRQWFAITLAWPDNAPEIHSFPEVTADLIGTTLLAMGRLGAGEEIPTSYMEKSSAARVAKARTLADRAIPIANTPQKLQEKVQIFLKEIGVDTPDACCVEEILLIAYAAYEAGVKDAFEQCGVDWSKWGLSLRVQVMKLPKTQRARWLVEQISMATIARTEQEVMLQMLLDEGAEAIPLIQAELERHKDDAHPRIGLTLLVDALGCFIYFDEQALKGLERVAKSFSDKGLCTRAQRYLENYEKGKEILKPFLGCAPLPAHTPIKGP